ncbi:MAG: TVP38/TMEM64 family protein [Acidobacteria bacterium]|nr:TVP38/TMEM64 family protein [Acidobacteriota bacterium]
MNTRRVLLVLVIVAMFAAAAYFLPIAGWTTSLAERARGTGALGVAIFVAAYVAATVAILPGSILTLAAGFAYGPGWGLAIASPASVAGATAAFLLGRTLLRDWAVRKTSDSARVRAIGQAVEREGFKLVLLLRLSPLLPFNLLNYALSLSNVRVRTYVAASALGMLPGTALYVYLGSLAPTAAQLSAAAEGGGASRAALYVAGLAATIAVVVIVTRAARRALDAELQRTT